MRNTRLPTAILLASVLALPSAGARANDDVRDIRPSVMLLVDTSGSMERLPGCECTSTECDECYPTCEADGSGNVARSKWHMVLEALTGRWPQFACERVERPEGAYDSGYPIPHFNHPSTATQSSDGLIDDFRERVLFGLMTFDAQPTWDGQPALLTSSAWDETQSQGAAGHFSYGTSEDFGFPGCGGEAHMMNNGARSESSVVGPLVSSGTGDETINDEIQKALLGDGVRYEELRPFGATPLAGMLDDLEHYMQTNPDVLAAGDALDACRPRYAVIITDGEPNADMRDEPFNCEVTQPDNPFGCPYDRPEEIVARLCEVDGNGQCAGDLSGVFVVGFDIAEGSARERLNDMADLGGTGEAIFVSSTSELESALADVLSQAAITVTSRTAPVLTNSFGHYHAQYNSGFRQTASGPWEGILERRRFECGTDSLVPEAQPVTDADRFQKVISAQSSRWLWTALPDSACQVRSHITGPAASGLDSLAFSGGSSGGGSGGGGNGNHGNGGKNTTCGSSSGNGNNHQQQTAAVCPVPPASVGNDAFNGACGSTSGNGNGNGGGKNGNGNGNGGGNGGGTTTTGPVDTDVTRVDLTSSIARDFFFVATNEQRDTIVDWLHGEGRDNDLGAILHSTPVVVNPPDQDIADESYNLFRRRAEVGNRPAVMYFGTSDGVLHCVSIRDQEVTIGGTTRTLAAGEELWGFVPPALFPTLQSAMVTQQPMLDGTPLVRDIFFKRDPGQDPDGSIYHTILITGFRQGGPGYVALDVTNPFDPKFLWQFTDENMGDTYGTPAIAQIVVKMPDGSLEERAIALLPGGAGDDLSNALGCGKCYVCNGVGQLETPTAEQVASGECELNEPLGCNTNGLGTPPANNGTINAREHHKCWGTRGRHLYLVDPATGELVDSLDDSVFGSPVVGGMAVFPGDVGTVATSAYTTDSDGQIWRIDISSTTIANWSASPLFDMFWGEGAADGQPAFEAPIVTTDPAGNVVIVQATGNIDLFDHFVRNKVVSITERFSISSQLDTQTNTQGVTLGSVGADLNWQITLRPSEQVTGPMALFGGNVFFGTFTGLPDQDDACAQGESRIWGVHYLNGVDPNSTTQSDASGACMNVADQTNQMDGVLWPEGALVGQDGADDAGRCIGPYANQVIMGVTVAQRPTCYDLLQPHIDDPFVPNRNTQGVSTGSTGGGTFELVAQTSGSSQSVPGASISDMTQALPVPVQFTRATASYAGRAE